MKCVRIIWRCVARPWLTVAPPIRPILFIAAALFLDLPGAFASDTRVNVDWPSPDGKFAFRATYGQDLHTIDLIDKTSGRNLQRIGEEDLSQADWHVLWAPDSERFALMTRMGHPI